VATVPGHPAFRPWGPLGHDAMRPGDGEAETESGSGAARPEPKRPGGHKATRSARGCREARIFWPRGTPRPIVARVAGLPCGVPSGAIHEMSSGEGPSPAPSTRHLGRDDGVRTPGTPVATSARRICRKPGAKIAAMPAPPLSCGFRTRIAFKIHTIIKLARTFRIERARGAWTMIRHRFWHPKVTVRFHEISGMSRRASARHSGMLVPARNAGPGPERRSRPGRLSAQEQRSHCGTVFPLLGRLGLEERWGREGGR
jgi:hypothetical protein